jgi:hypothetical protein
MKFKICPITKLILIIGFMILILCIMDNNVEKFGQKINILNSCQHDGDCQGAFGGCVRKTGLRDRNTTEYNGNKVCAMIPSGCNHAGGPPFCKCINKDLADKISNGQKVLRFNG